MWGKVMFRLMGSCWTCVLVGSGVAVGSSRRGTNLSPRLIHHQLRPHDDAAVVVELGHHEHEHHDDGHDRDDAARGRADARVLDRLGECVEAGEPRASSHGCWWSGGALCRLCYAADGRDARMAYWEREEGAARLGIWQRKRNRSEGGGGGMFGCVYSAPLTLRAAYSRRGHRCCNEWPFWLPRRGSVPGCGQPQGGLWRCGAQPQQRLPQQGGTRNAGATG